MNQMIRLYEKEREYRVVNDELGEVWGYFDTEAEAKAFRNSYSLLVLSVERCVDGIWLPC